MCLGQIQPRLQIMTACLYVSMGTLTTCWPAAKLRPAAQRIVRAYVGAVAK